MKKIKVLSLIVGTGALVMAPHAINHVSKTKEVNQVLLVKNDSANQKNNTLSASQIKNLKNKTITVNGMKFSGLKAVKIAPDMNTNSFAVTPNFNQNGFASNVNEELYNYELNPNNDQAAMNEATELHDGNPVNTCVFFQSSALRAIGQNVPDSIGYTTVLENWLSNNGWTRHTDFQYLQKGDLCFAGTYHTFLFMGWKDKAQGIAYVMGNESYVQPYYRNRNLSGQSPAIYGNNSYYETTCYWTYGQGYTGKISGIDPVHEGGYDAIGTTVTTANVNLRAESNINSEVYGQIPNNTKVPVISQNNGWDQVYYDGHTGWIDGSYTNGLAESLGGNTSSPSSQVPDSNLPTLTITSNNSIWEYSQANVNSNQIIQLSQGTTASVLGYKGNWFKINYDGCVGWINGNATNVEGQKIGQDFNPVNGDSSNSHNIHKTTKTKKNNTSTINNNTGNSSKNKPNSNGYIGKIRVESILGVDLDSQIESTEITTIPNNTILNVLSEHNGYFKVSYNGQIGWVQGQFTSALNDIGSTYNQVNLVGLTMTSKPIYANGSELSNSIGSIPSSTVLNLIGQDGNWYKVSYNGVTGWINSSNLNVI